jgi:hypothetical protein
MGLTPLMLFTVTLLIVRNQRILHAWDARQEESARRSVRMTSARNPARRQRRPMSQRTRPRFPVATTDKHGHLK